MINNAMRKINHEMQHNSMQCNYITQYTSYHPLYM